MNKAIKHAYAKSIRIALMANDNSISLTIKDDGKGFCTETITTGNGLKSIRRRAALLGWQN